MRRVSALLCVCAVLLATGCASIVSTSNYPVQISSNPPGASVTIKDKRGMDVFTGTTPTTAMLSAGKSYFSSARYMLTFTKPGYATTTRSLGASLDLWYLGNILFGGLIGMLIVDPITGDMWKLDEYVNVVLLEQGKGPAATAPAPAPMATQNEELKKGLDDLKKLRGEGVLTEEEYQRKRQELIDKWNP